MPFRCPRRLPSALASALAAGTVLAVAACAGAITPLGPDAAAAMPQPHHLRSPLILQDVRVQPLTPAGSCPPGYAASPGQCYGRATGRPVTITSAGVSPVSQFRPPTPSGQPAPPAEYGFWITVPAADVKALATVIPAPAGPPGQLTARPVPASAGVPAIRVAGRTWVLVGFSRQPSGRALKLFLLSQDQAAQLQGILAASG